MREFLDQKVTAWKEHSSKFTCQHEETALRKRTVKGGAIQYVRQCLRCGESPYQAIARAKALGENGGVEPPSFDEAIRSKWEELRNNDSEVIKKRFSKEAFFSNYSEYLASDVWEKKRQRVLMRARGSCEGCGEREPTEVHHLTYKHVTKEFLFELVALCHECHERFHDDESST